MKVLIATKRGQGKRANDFSFAEPGELVTISMECDREKVDGECGCRRSLPGVTSHVATTTFEVAELGLTMSQYERIHADSAVAGGWFQNRQSDKDLREFAALVAKDLARVASKFAVGTVVERRGDTYQERFYPDAL
jgi:hypothetical protein